MQNESTNGTDDHFQSSLTMVHSAHTTPQSNGAHLEKNREKSCTTTDTVVCFDALLCYPIHRVLCVPAWAIPLYHRIHYYLFLVARIGFARAARNERNEQPLNVFSFFRVGQFVFEFNSAKCRATEWKWQKKETGTCEKRKNYARTAR